ncbi:MAG TPA: N,N-dimethylformamidase beta subunit family domain-containing protein [Gaiellaceae bacterium]
MSWSGTRRRLLALAGLGAIGSLGRLPLAAGAAPLLSRFRVGNGGHPFAGDRADLTTLGPTSGRTAAELRFSLARPSAVTLDVLQTGQGVASEKAVAVGQAELSAQRSLLGAGEHVVDWKPPANLAARTYILRLTATPRHGLGKPVATHGVARVLGVDAAFTVHTAAAGDSVDLYLRTDASTLTLQMMRSGLEQVPTYSNDNLNGILLGEPMPIDWRAYRNQPGIVTVQLDPSWGTGIYFARLEADDGRLGFAPIVIHPAAPAQRVAVVIPTSTWQAYNFYDANGDGWGDTWYARWKTDLVDITRPHPNRGIPYRYRSYDLQFQHWLTQTYKLVDTYGDEDIERFTDPTALRAAYDLIIFPGHTEYVSGRIYNLIQGYRDLGGNLMFLSANNFFRRIDRNNNHIKLIDEWRDLGRPEEALLGVHYIASDRGQRHAPFTVVGADVAPWAFVDTGLYNGAQFGSYGIEIDARGPASPPNVQVLATIPDLFGAGRSAEMTYYEHASGAKVFSAGALNFGGQIMLWPATQQLLQNVWNQLA